MESIRSGGGGGGQMNYDRLPKNLSIAWGPGE